MRPSRIRKLSIESLERREMLSADPLHSHAASDGLLDNGSTAGQAEVVSTTAQNSVARAATLLPGDYDGNGEVGFSDLQLLLEGFGKTVTPGTGADGNGSGRIDIGDINLLSLNFGKKLPTNPDPDPNPDPGGNPAPHAPHGDVFPDFAESPTLTAVASGNWSNPSTWSAGRVPNATDVVAIENAEVLISDTTAVVDRLVIHGTLRFATDRDTQLRVSTLHVHEHGSLIMGTEDAPITATAKLVIRDTPLDLIHDPQQYGTGLIVEGTIRVHGMSKTAFERLAAEPLAGSTQLQFAASVQGWQVGDRLFLPDTRQLTGYNWGANYSAEVEYGVVSAISADGRTITLSQPLQFDHIGARDGDGILMLLPHVANVTRNVSILSENPLGTRGHTMFTRRADVDVRYATFDDLGRTTGDPLNSTTFHEDGSVAHVGTNQIGRYSIHIHHLDGPEVTPENGYQYTLVGVVSNGESAGNNELHKFKWGLTIHDSHYGLMQDNVVVNWGGAGLVFEEASESHNLIDHNFFGRIWGIANSRADADPGIAAGYGMWIGTNSTVRNNVVANVFAAFDSARATGITIVNNALAEVPVSPGSSQSTIVDLINTPMREFDTNEVYGTMFNALDYWSIGGGDERGLNDGTAPSWIRDFTGWHYYQFGVHGYPSENVKFDGLTLIGDYAQFRDGQVFSTGLTGGDYAQPGQEITNANIQNNFVGLGFSTVTYGQEQKLVDSYLRNTINIQLGTLVWGSGNSLDLEKRVVRIENVRFEKPAVGRFWYHIQMAFGGNGANYIVPDEIYVTSFNGVTGDNFRVYYAEQRPNFVVPQGNGNGSPDAGLTNQQNWDLHGIAIAGAIAPENANTRPDIDGLFVPLP